MTNYDPTQQYPWESHEQFLARSTEMRAMCEYTSELGAQIYDRKTMQALEDKDIPTAVDHFFEANKFLRTAQIYRRGAEK
jgi:hypothetical protein